MDSSNSLLLSVFINHRFDEELSSFVRGTHHWPRRHVSEALENIKRNQFYVETKVPMLYGHRLGIHCIDSVWIAI